MYRRKCRGKSPTNQRSNVIYKFVCHCESVYVGKTIQQLQQQIKRHVPRTFINGTKSPKLTSAIGQHLESSLVCRQQYSDDRFTIITRGRGQFHLDVLEALYIQTLKPVLCIQKQYVYNTILYKMLK